MVVKSANKYGVSGFTFASWWAGIRGSAEGFIVLGASKTVKQGRGRDLEKVEMNS